VACQHGTYVAGILVARRGGTAPAICPGCTLLVRPIFAEMTGREPMPSATSEVLAAAILDCIRVGARILNLSAALSPPSLAGHRAMEEALDHAARRGVLVVTAAGNQGTLASTAITRHPWVIPVAACGAGGRPAGESNLGRTIGRRGLRAPGAGITSLGAGGPPLTWSGTSVAAPFVTGAIALLWSVFPAATAAEIKQATTRVPDVRRRAVVPPLLDVRAAHRTLAGVSLVPRH
jgi:subtilisin family serine protease